MRVRNILIFLTTEILRSCSLFFAGAAFLLPGARRLTPQKVGKASLTQAQSVALLLLRL
jgi:hypothetical protein